MALSLGQRFKRARKAYQRAKKRVRAQHTKWHKAIAKKRATKQKSPARIKANRRIRKVRKYLRWAIMSRTAHRKKLRKAKTRYYEAKEQDQNVVPGFELFMLNGCPNTLSDAMKAVVAYEVVVNDMYITATSNGTHATGSYHYYSPCRAIDCAGSRMWETYDDTRNKFGGPPAWVELFGPGSWYVKNGVQYGGQFPGHTTHKHDALRF